MYYGQYPKYKEQHNKQVEYWINKEQANQYLEIEYQANYCWNGIYKTH